MAKIKCSMCGRMVEVSKKGRVGQHHNLPKSKICLNSGQSIVTNDFINKSREKK